ncbi:MAG: hypothetical protein J7L42_01340, partial [Elusimicrobia bacterium]|nr:hypothetical protein [Elusimicrobiota bacterium]
MKKNKKLQIKNDKLKMKAGAIKQIAIKRLSEIKNIHYSLFAVCYLLFALLFAGCVPSGILKTNPVKIASKLEQKNTDEAIRIL